jgi:transcriptional regulator with XRE-family HTH domain
LIKLTLKKNNITLSQFATDLNISRPTLDSYINAFDSGTPLVNALYQEIFEFLFNDATISDTEFSNRYEYMKSYYYSSGGAFSFNKSTVDQKDEYDNLLDDIWELVKREKAAKTLSTSTLKSIIDIMESDATEVADYTKFIAYLKGLRKIGVLTDDEQKRLYFFYQSERSYKHPRTTVDDNVFNRFLEECNKNFLETTQKAKKIKDVIDEKITNLIKSELSKVKDTDDIVIEDVIDIIKKKL